MFILATLVNWRFPKQRMKRDASSICNSTIVLYCKYNINILEAYNVWTVVIYYSKVIFIYAKWWHILHKK